MASIVYLRTHIGKIQADLDSIRAAAMKAMPQALRVFWMNVIDLTPRGVTNELARSVKHEVTGDGLQGRVYSTGGVVAKVMEGRPLAQWSKFPPFRALLQWVVGKIGLSGKEADSMAWAVRANIKKRGIQIPLKQDQRGGMFHRTVEKARATNFHMVAFISALKKLETSAGLEEDIQPELFD